MTQEFELLEKTLGKELIDELGFAFLMEVSPAAIKAFVQETVARMEAGVIDRKWQELIWLAGCFVARCKSGVKAHCLGALQAGATKEEIIETLLLVSLVGSHCIVVDGLSSGIESYLKDTGGAEG